MCPAPGSYGQRSAAGHRCRTQRELGANGDVRLLVWWLTLRTIEGQLQRKLEGHLKADPCGSRKRGMWVYAFSTVFGLREDGTVK